MVWRNTFSVLALVLAGCDLDTLETAGVTEEFRQEFAMKPGGRLSVDNQNGSVEVTGWDRDRIEIEGTKFASDKAALAELKVDIRDTGGSFEVRTLRPAAWTRHSRGGVRYRIHVPRKTRLDRFGSTNGSLRAGAIDEQVKMRTTNGSIVLSQVNGDADLGTTNGKVELRDLSGDAVVHTTNGDIVASGVKGRVDASTTNGGIEVSAVELGNGASSRLHTTNGGIRLTVDSFRGGDIDADTTNGAIKLRIPAGVNADLRASTTSAKIHTDFPVQHLIESKGRRLDAKLGSGGPRIGLRTSNGSIHIEKH